MDKLAERLREDAARIEVTVTAGLEDRIRASLEAAAEEQRQSPLQTPRHRPKSFGLWWLSTVTGAVLAAALIVALNLWPSATEQGAVPAEPPDVADLGIPPVPLKLRPAVLTRPLEEEYELLQSDLEKAGATVRDSLDQVF